MQRQCPTHVKAKGLQTIQAPLTWLPLGWSGAPWEGNQARKALCPLSNADGSMESDPCWLLTRHHTACSDSCPLDMSRDDPG